MNKLITITSILCLSCSLAYAEEQELQANTNNIEDLAERLNVIKPDDYVEMTQPIKEYAHQTAKNLTPQEIALINSAQKRINHDLARRQGTEEQEVIQLDSKNKQQIEDFLTPPMYTYDDIQ